MRILSHPFFSAGAAFSGRRRARDGREWRLLLCLAAVILRGYLAPLDAQTQWYDHYANAREAIAGARWETAVAELNRALSQKSNPQPEAETYALRFIDYLPYFWRGVARFNLGEYQKAQDDFRQSLNWNAIKQTPHLHTLNRYLRLTGQMSAVVDSLNSMHREVEKLSGAGQKTAGLEPLLTELADALSRPAYDRARMVLNRIRQQYPGVELSRWEPLLRDLEALQGAGERQAADARAAALFDAALAQYLAGDYQGALSKFLQLEAQTGEFAQGGPLRQVEDWIRKTRAEMARLGQKPDTLLRTIVRRDTITVAPVVAFATESASTRSDSIVISGYARDDQGIAELTFTLNGEALRNATGDTVRIVPPSPESSQGFPFTLIVPLQPGENQMVAIARDVDVASHRATFPLLLKRKPPLYHEPLVLGGMGVVLVLALGGMAANHYIKRRIAFVNRYNPYIAGAPVRNEKMFFGREALLRRVINSLHNNSLLLHGPRRIGKTSLLHQLKKQLENENDPHYFFVPVYIDLQGTPEDRFFSVLMHDIADGCESYVHEKPDLSIYGDARDYSARDFNTDIKTLLKLLNGLSRKTLKLVLLIDEVDELNGYSAKTNQKLRSIFMKTFAENLVAVMAGTHIRKRWESEGSPWYNFFEEIAIGGIDRDAAEKLVREPVKGIFYYDHAAVQKILTLSELIPYRIQRICVNVVARVIECRRRRITAADVEVVTREIFQEETI